MKTNKTATLKDVTDKLDEFLKVLDEFKEGQPDNKVYREQLTWCVTSDIRDKYQYIMRDLNTISVYGMTLDQRRSLSLNKALNRLTNNDLQKLVDVAALFTHKARKIHGACNPYDSENEATTHEVNEAILKALRNRL